MHFECIDTVYESVIETVLGSFREIMRWFIETVLFMDGYVLFLTVIISILVYIIGSITNIYIYMSCHCVSVVWTVV